MKKCRRCGEDKPRSEFSPNKRHKDGLASYCKACRRRDYPANPETTRKYREGRRDELNAKTTRVYRDRRAKITALKLTLSCVDCGWSPQDESEVGRLEFDHIDPTTKHHAGTAAFIPLWSWERIRRFEPIGNVDEIPEQLQGLIQQAVEARTGKAPLPFGQVDDYEVGDDQ